MPRGVPLRAFALPLLLAVALPVGALTALAVHRIDHVRRRLALSTARSEAMAVAAGTVSLIDSIPRVIVPLAVHFPHRPGALRCDAALLRTALGIQGLSVEVAGHRSVCGRHPPVVPPGAAHGLHRGGAPLGRHGIIAVEAAGGHGGVVVAAIDAVRLLRQAARIPLAGRAGIELVDGHGRRVAAIGVANQGQGVASVSAPVQGSGWQIRVSLQRGDIGSFHSLSLSALAMLLAGVGFGGALLVGRYAGPEPVATLGESPKSLYGPSTAVVARDGLTGLPERTGLRAELKRAMRRAQEGEQLSALMMLDIDRFKTVNDTLDHNVGDALIRAVAQRLQRSCAGRGFLARLGGDEFAVIHEAAAGVAAVEAFANRLLEAIARPYELSGYEIFATASVGIVLFPVEEASVDQLIARADTAMFHAKRAGRNCFEFYSPQMNARSLHRLVLENSLRGALRRQEFEVHYQPQFEVATGRPVGMEALLRWQHPEWGAIAPAEFVPLLEETGLILEVGNWVLRRACAQAAAWQRDGYGSLRVSVNLAALQLRQKDLAQQVAAALAETGLAPRDLELELTESVLMEEADAPLETLAALRSTGVSLAIDDFGTGYSSLGYLKRFPVDALKIDREFVRDIESDLDDASIVGAIVHLAHSLGFRVVAEGVESSGQLAALRAHGCDEVQGFLFGRPLPPEKLALSFSSPR